MSRTAEQMLARIGALKLDRPLRILNVCGGHERTISFAGLRQVLPDGIELIPGPGCPVCVCPEEAIRLAIRIASQTDAILLSFGDMLRVPINGPKRTPRSLAEARADGADIRPIASPLEAISTAQENPNRAVVFFATGFETTTAPVAAALAEAPPPNLSVLLSARLTWPAVRMLLDSGDIGFDALIAPGHVATVMGAEEWRFVPDDFGLPAAIAGFTPETLLAAIYAVGRQSIDGTPRLDNCYGAVVRPGGNPLARRLLDEMFSVETAHWRGIGPVPGSGFALRERYATLDARRVFSGLADTAGDGGNAMPPGCDCARVVLGQIRPTDCALFGRACTPKKPVGPCMVSDEGACRIWWATGHRNPDPKTHEAA